MSETQHPQKTARVIVTADGELYGEDTPETRELARRVQACINACEGIPTEELEKGVIKDMRRFIELVSPLLPGGNNSSSTPAKEDESR